jgi:hypothetical protein
MTTSQLALRQALDEYARYVFSCREDGATPVRFGDWLPKHTTAQTPATHWVPDVQARNVDGFVAQCGTLTQNYVGW